MPSGRSFWLLSICVVACGTRFGAVYPPRPASSPGAPIADSAPSRVVAHLSVTSKALADATHASVPATGEGTFTMLGKERAYRWEREPFAVTFSGQRIVLETRVMASLSLPITSVTVPLNVRVAAEPVINTEYAVRLQSTDVKVTSSDSRVKIADAAADVMGKVGREIDGKLKSFRYDLRPLMAQAHGRIRKPIRFPLGEAEGCAHLAVLGMEAGPTVIADGLEKDIALVVAPSVTIPCVDNVDDVALPPLSNVASIPSGPFTVAVGIAAQYEELAKAMGLLFADGRYYFSAQYPGLYLSDPQVYASDDKIVLRVHIAGPVKALGIESNLDGDLFLAGRPTLVDNEITFPDLEPTIETRSFFLKLKAMSDGDKMRDDARRALRINLTERFATVRAELSDALVFGDEKACFRGSVDKVDVTGIYPHGSYIRVGVALTARARVSMPCEATQPAKP